jgi:abhydrolase domain-containing protein 6
MGPLNGIFDRFRPKLYARRPPLILINGLAEQPESWFRNRRYWMRFFDVFTPNILAYDGPMIQERVARKEPITVEYFVEQYRQFMIQYVQKPPYHIVASSLGGKIAVELAAKHPELINRVVLICPSGMGDVEKLPIMEGVKGRDTYALVRSVFHRPKFVDRDMLKFYKQQMTERKWKAGLLRTVRGTMDHTVRQRLKDVKAETLVITGLEDKICCPKTAEEASADLPRGAFVAIPKCGHAPQIEKSRFVNRLVAQFLSSPKPTTHRRWGQLLAKPR